jgi:ferritin heavy chain
VATLALRCYTETLFTDANFPETTCTVEFAPPFSDAAITSMRPPKELDNGASLSRLGFSDAVEAALNAQVNVEMSASMNYLAMSNYFARDSVALPGLAAHFRKESNEEREHAEQVMEYQTERGGKVILGPLAAPPSEFGEGNNKDALNAAELALSMEKLNLTKLLQLHVVADKAGDCQTCDYVEGDLLQPQRASVDEAARMVRKLHRIGDNGHGVWDFDRSLA